jgi:hypothetical protein
VGVEELGSLWNHPLELLVVSGEKSPRAFDGLFHVSRNLQR